MVKRIWIIMVLLVVLVAGVILEQIYTDETYASMGVQTTELHSTILEGDLEGSREAIEDLQEYWSGREVVASLLVDYRDIEQIGRQIALVNAHLNNSDLELAKVESTLLKHILDTYRSTIGFDWQNII